MVWEELNREKKKKQLREFSKHLAVKSTLFEKHFTFRWMMRMWTVVMRPKLPWGIWKIISFKTIFYLAFSKYVLPHGLHICSNYKVFYKVGKNFKLNSGQTLFPPQERHHQHGSTTLKTDNLLYLPWKTNNTRQNRWQDALKTPNVALFQCYLQ